MFLTRGRSRGTSGSFGVDDSSIPLRGSLSNKRTTTAVRDETPPASLTSERGSSEVILACFARSRDQPIRSRSALRRTRSARPACSRSLPPVAHENATRARRFHHPSRASARPDGTRRHARHPPGNDDRTPAADARLLAGERPGGQPTACTLGSRAAALDRVSGGGTERGRCSRKARTVKHRRNVAEGRVTRSVVRDGFAVSSSRGTQSVPRTTAAAPSREQRGLSRSSLRSS